MEQSLLNKVSKAPLKISSQLVEDIFLWANVKAHKDATLYDALIAVGVDEEHVEYVASVISDEFYPDEEKEGDEELNEIERLKRKRIEALKRRKAGNTTLGSQFSEVFKEADFTAQCLYIANFSPVEAERIYHEVDFRLVSEAFRLKNSVVLAGVFSVNEAVGLVFGGGDSKGGETSYHDVSELSAPVSG